LTRGVVLQAKQRRDSDQASSVAGFTLIELAVVLLLVSFIVGTAVVAGKTVVDAAQQQQTAVKMSAIKQALYTWRKAYNRLPCPASLTLATISANFGVEGPKSANCIDGVAGNATATNNTAGNTVSEGAVPVRSLGLSDDTAFDGWGNRIRYAVSVPFTTTGAFTTYAVNNTGASAIMVLDGTGASNYRTQNAMFALISTGSDRYGAYTKGGSLVNLTATVNADEQQNCHCNSGGATAYDGKYVQKALVTSSAANYYDDIVDYGMRWQMQTALDSPASGYTYYASITIDHTKVSTNPQTNFPILFSGTYDGTGGKPDLRVMGSGGAVTSSSGYDIIFATSATCGTPLPFEQESYVSTTGVVSYWVKIPTLSNTVDTVIYLCYGNALVTTDQSTKTAVWDSNFKAVWHLPNGTALSVLDSTSNGNNGTNNGSAGAAAGKIDGAASFNGTGSQYISTSLVLPTTNFTYSFWANSGTSGPSNRPVGAADYLAGVNGTSVLWGYASAGQLYTVFRQGSNVGTGDIASVSASGLNTGWHYVTVVMDSTNGGIVYYDGAQAGTNSAYKSITTGSLTLTIGKEPNQNSGGFNGTVDEVKVSNVVRSADWIRTEYNNQNSPSTFYTIGTPTAM
jgi:type II secretory pathway pseudopilin PulG